MKRFPLHFMIPLAFLGILASAAAASASPARWEREYQRDQQEILRQQRERELESVRHSTRHAQEELQHWYQRERNRLQADFQRARNHLRGRAWTDYVRRHSERLADLARHYADQQRALIQQKVEAEKSIRDYYQHEQRRIADRHAPPYYGHQPHRSGPSFHAAPAHSRVPSAARPSFSLQLPRFGISIR